MVGSWAEGIAGAFGGAAPGWLALGIVAHVLNQVARGLGWCAIVRGACGPATVRRREVVGAWVAGAGAGGILSARGGDAVRVLLLSRRMPDSRGSVLAGTLVAEAAGDTLIGAAVLLLAVSLGAAPALGFPGAGTAAGVGAGLLLLAGGLLLLARRRGADGTPRESRLRRTLAGVGRGCAPLTRPGEFARRVLPWQALSRGLRGCAIFCFLAAFHLPAGVAAVLLVMLAQTGGRLLPLAPASAAAAVGMLTAGFAPATGAAVSVGAVATFMVGMSTILTITGAALTAAVVCLTAGPGAAAAVWHAATPRRAARAPAT